MHFTVKSSLAIYAISTLNRPTLSVSAQDVEAPSGLNRIKICICIQYTYIYIYIYYVRPHIKGEFMAGTRWEHPIPPRLL